MSRVKLANESAAGIYTFSWTDPDGITCRVQWGSGLPEPVAVYGRSSMRDIANPERYGWPGTWRVERMGHTRKIAAVRSLAQRFADELAEQTAAVVTEDQVRRVLAATGVPELVQEGTGPDWRVVTPGWHVFTYEGEVRVLWWSDGTLSTDPAAWAADTANLTRLRPALESAGLAVTAPDPSVLEVSAGTNPAAPGR